MRCPVCSSANFDGARFCDQCAAPLSAPCPRCEVVNRPGARFCSGCSAALDLSPSQPTPPPMTGEASAPRAERRHLTVLFCDLVSSTEFAAKLDPEDWQQIVTSYHNAATDTVTRFGGHVALYLGDGLLVFFGYPQANEDDPQRAVMAGLALVEAIAALNAKLFGADDRKLAIRVGIHSGPVVVGDGSARRANIFGPVPNIAAHVESAAAPNTVLITDAVHQLVSGMFVVEDLGSRPLKDGKRPVHLYRVIQWSGVRGRLAASAAAGFTPFVGREDELRLLHNRWDRVRAGSGQVALIIGEPGIGKSRLIQRFRSQIADIPHLWVDCNAAALHQNTPFYGVEDILRQTLRWSPAQNTEEHFAVMEASLGMAGLNLNEAVPLFASLMNLPPSEKYPPLQLEPDQRRKRLLAAITAWALGSAKIQPLVVASEDLHWSDPSTLEVMQLLAEQGANSPMFLLCTGRPEFRAPWPLHAHHTQLTLNRLSARDAREMVTRIDPLAASTTADAVVERSGGVPFFVEELTRSVMTDGNPNPAEREIPATLHDSLMARLDRLGEVREVAQIASVIGHEFSWKMLSAVTHIGEEKLAASLKALTDSLLLFPQGMPPDATYTFRHALIGDAAYNSLLRSKRQHYHGLIAEFLEQAPPDSPGTRPQLLAHHYTEAGLIDRAIPQWQMAGQMAIQRSANAEAINHLTKGLDLLKTLPATPASFQQELKFQLTLGPPLVAIKGFASPEAKAAYGRARELCLQAGEAPELFPVQWGLWLSYTARSELDVARELAEQCLRIAHSAREPELLVEANHALGVTLTGLGELVAGLDHLNYVIGRHDPFSPHARSFPYGQDPKVVCLSQAAWATWVHGYPNRAVALNREAIALARNLSHPYTLATALNFGAMLHQFFADDQTVSEYAGTAITLSTEHDFAFLKLWGSLMLGWTVAQRGETASGIGQMRDSIMAFRATGADVMVPYFLTLLAEAYGKAGQVDQGINFLNDAQSVADHGHERWWEAEIYRLRGELTLIDRDGQSMPSIGHKDAEEYFLQAINIASRQSARSLELRAVMSLARFWQRQDKTSAARQLLIQTLDGFKEGFETADLVAAKALLASAS